MPTEVKKTPKGGKIWLEQQKNLCEEKRISLNKLNLEGVIVFFLAGNMLQDSHQLAPLHSTDTLETIEYGNLVRD